MVILYVAVKADTRTCIQAHTPAGTPHCSLKSAMAATMTSQKAFLGSRVEAKPTR